MVLTVLGDPLAPQLLSHLLSFKKLTIPCECCGGYTRMEAPKEQEGDVWCQGAGAIVSCELVTELGL